LRARSTPAVSLRQPVRHRADLGRPGASRRQLPSVADDREPRIPRNIWHGDVLVEQLEEYTDDGLQALRQRGGGRTPSGRRASVPLSVRGVLKCPQLSFQRPDRALDPGQRRERVIEREALPAQEPPLQELRRTKDAGQWAA
jgi:hypothetical protein